MKPKSKLTLGLKVLQVLSIILGILEVISLIGLITLGGSVGASDGVPYLHFGYAIFGILFYVLFLIAIRKPSKSLYKIVMLLLAVDLVLSAVFIFISFQELSTNILSILIDIAVGVYFIKIKDYFFAGSIDKENPSIKKTDKRFVIVIVILLILQITIPFVIGFTAGITRGISQAQESVQLVNALKGKTTDQALEYCKSLSGDILNVCILSLIIHSDKSNSLGTNTVALSDSKPLDVGACSYMNGDSAKTTCYALLNRCDLVSDEKTQKLCTEILSNYQARMQSSK